MSCEITEKRRLRCLSRVALGAALVVSLGSPALAGKGSSKLPAPTLDGDVSLEQAMKQRRSRRHNDAAPLAPEILGQLLWAAQGVTDSKGHRTAPSAGARYPLELYVLTAEGAFHYLPRQHALKRVRDADVRATLWKDVYARPWLSDSPAIFIFTAVYQRTSSKYGAKAERFVHIEVGHAGQNLLLQATALGLHCVGIGAFHPVRVKKTLGFLGDPVYVIAVGMPPVK